MARGWESKSVESQLDDREAFARVECRPAECTAAERELELLELTRKRLLHEIAFASTKGFRAIKQRALSHIEGKIEAVRGRVEPPPL